MYAPQVRRQLSYCLAGPVEKHTVQCARRRGSDWSGRLVYTASTLFSLLVVSPTSHTSKNKNKTKKPKEACAEDVHVHVHSCSQSMPRSAVIRTAGKEATRPRSDTGSDCPCLSPCNPCRSNSRSSSSDLTAEK